MRSSSVWQHGLEAREERGKTLLVKTSAGMLDESSLSLWLREYGCPGQAWHTGRGAKLEGSWILFQKSTVGLLSDQAVGNFKQYLLQVRACSILQIGDANSLFVFLVLLCSFTFRCQICPNVLWLMWQDNLAHDFITLWDFLGREVWLGCEYKSEDLSKHTNHSTRVTQIEVWDRTCQRRTTWKLCIKLLCKKKWLCVCICTHGPRETDWRVHGPALTCSEGRIKSHTVNVYYFSFARSPTDKTHIAAFGCLTPGIFHRFAALHSLSHTHAAACASDVIPPTVVQLWWNWTEKQNSSVKA